MSALRGLPSLARALLVETWRSKPAVFWNLVLPLLYIVGLSYIFGGGETARVERIVPGILTISLITTCFFGVSLHMVSLREAEIYRHFRVTPVTAITVVLAHGFTALVNILVGTALQLVVAALLFHIQIRGSVVDLTLAILLVAFGFIPLGLLVGSIAQDMRTGPILSNILFLPMMFLSGAAMPLFLMPPWMQHLATLLPATYVVEIFRGAIMHGSALFENGLPAAILLLTGGAGFLFNALLFRWETTEPLNRRGLALSLLTLLVIYGAAFLGGVRLDAATGPETESSGGPGIQVPPGARVLRGMTILDGLGGRTDRGRIVLKGNRIIAVGADTGELPAQTDVVDLTGRYVIPGLIDSHVHIGGSSGGDASSEEFEPSRVIHDLQVDLAMGVTTIVSMTDDVDDLIQLRAAVAAGTMRAPRLYFTGPGLTAPGGHPARYFRVVPGLAERMTRQVSTAAEAEKAVRGLAAKRVDLIKLFLESGWSGEPQPVLSESAFRAGVRIARELGLKATVHIDSDAHLRLALDAGVSSIEHLPPDLSDASIRELVAKKIPMTPTVVATEGLARAISGVPVTDPAVSKWILPAVVKSLSSPDSWLARERASPAAVAYYTQRHARVVASLRKAVLGGVTLLAGTDCGNPGAWPGLGLHRELQILVQDGGMIPAAALQAATGAAAKRLGTSEVGQIAPGAFADLVVLDADPTRDIRALDAIRSVYLGGVLLQRETLLTTSPGPWSPLAGGTSE